MISSLIAAVHAAGGLIERHGKEIELSAPLPLPDDLIAQLRKAKPALLAHLHHAAVEPVLLADGRRLHRFPGSRPIPVDSLGRLLPLLKLVRSYGVAMIADGRDLLVIEPWLSELPPQTLEQIKGAASEVIALLRDECANRDLEVPL
jgi:hypothetical protein